MGMAAILDMCLSSPEQNFVSPPYGGLTYNLASIGAVVSGEEMFENVDRLTTDA